MLPLQDDIITKPNANFNTIRTKTLSHNAVIYSQDIINNHRLSFTKVSPIINYEMIANSYPFNGQCILVLGSLATAFLH